MLDDNANLGLTHLRPAENGQRPAGVRRGEHRRLAGNDLDDVGAIAHLAAHGPDELDLAVRLDPEHVAVSAGDADGKAGGLEPRSRGAGIDSVAQPDVDVALCARAACARYPSAQGPPGLLGCGRRYVEIRSCYVRGEVSDRGIKGVVHVAIDQAGQKSFPAPINNLDSLRHGPAGATGEHGTDPLTFDDDVNLGQRRVRYAVDQPDSRNR